MEVIMILSLSLSLKDNKMLIILTNELSTFVPSLTRQLECAKLIDRIILL